MKIIMGRKKKVEPSSKGDSATQGEYKPPPEWATATTQKEFQGLAAVLAAGKLFELNSLTTGKQNVELEDEYHGKGDKIGQIYKVVAGQGGRLAPLYIDSPTGEGPNVVDDFYVPSAQPIEQGRSITVGSLALATFSSPAILTGRAIQEKQQRFLRDAKKVEAAFVANLNNDGTLRSGWDAKRTAGKTIKDMYNLEIAMKAVSKAKEKIAASRYDAAASVNLGTTNQGDANENDGCGDDAGADEEFPRSEVPDLRDEEPPASYRPDGWLAAMILGTYSTFPPISQSPFPLLHAHDDDDGGKDKSREAQRKAEREANEKKRATLAEKDSVPGLRGRNVSECIQLAQVQGSYDLRKLEGSLLILSQKRLLVSELMNKAAQLVQSTSSHYTDEMKAASAKLNSNISLNSRRSTMTSPHCRKKSQIRTVVTSFVWALSAQRRRPPTPRS